jgi:hypothetical protein
MSCFISEPYRGAIYILEPARRSPFGVPPKPFSPGRADVAGQAPLSVTYR